jgi:hypothetical protein
MLKMKSNAGNYVSQKILFGWMLLLIAGCSQITSSSTTRDETSTPSAPANEPEGVVTQMNPSATPFASGLENLIEKAKDDLAQRLDIPITQISLVEATAVEWSDSSLGCPQPDMFYTQVITPGYRILFDFNGQQYEYHSNRETYFVYCENLIPPILPKP